MREILEALVETMHDQAMALQAVAAEVTALKQTLAKREEELAEELKRQIEAVAMQLVGDRVTTVQRTLAEHEGGLSSELKTQAEAEREKNRAAVYEMQANLARLREGIARLPRAEAAPGKKQAPRVRKATAPRPAGQKATRRRV